MTEARPDNGENSALSGKDFFFKAGAGGSLASYEKSSPIYSLLSGQRVGQIPIDEHKEIDREECAAHQKIFSNLQMLLLLLVFVCTRLPCVHILQTPVLNSALVLFALFACIVRYGLRQYHRTTWHLTLNSWVMLFFTAVVVWQTGFLSSPFLSLFFLCILLTGTALGTKAALQQAGAVTICWLLLAAADRKAFSGSLSALKIDAEYLAGPLIRLSLIWLLAWAVSLLSEEAEVTKEKIRQLSRTDQLTGLWNMKMLLIFMQREYQRILIRSGKFSVLMIDADSLKAVNDAFGHHAGTMLIVFISETMRTELREEDMLARFGGDEFVAFLPETSCKDAWKVAERLRRRIEDAPLMYEGHSVRITVSCGIACFPDHGEDLTEIMKMADRALYRSKDLGKNRCTIYGLEDEEVQDPPPA
ncbi:GGDEF domain-containing protein [Candidatus Electronema sp. PJ]|uniref:GGDEF domain-containing protein n=1 Tax=Candidatus Electronema sp. PJ TaxID=3401572 RepID=UPI003AA8A15D